MKFKCAAAMAACFPRPRRQIVALALLCSANLAQAADFGSVIKTVKSSVVAIGTLQKTRSPAILFTATGFVTGDGLTVITNAHVINPTLNLAEQETLGVLINRGDTQEFRAAAVTAIDEEHDLARLRIGGAPLPALVLGDAGTVSEGETIAFTGFPLAAVLGHQHVTHKGIVAAITPVARPALDSGRLATNVVAQLRRSPYMVFQLDATGYPGDSGSPVYDPDTGTVLGVINSVFVKGLKETAITHPSGITYAIPVNYVREILEMKTR